MPSLDKSKLYFRNLPWLFLAIFIFGLRTLYTFPIEAGGDALQKWNYVINFHNSNIDFFHSHHTMRWAVNLPGLLFYELIGPYPSTYYIAPLVAFSLYYTVILKIAKSYLRPVLFAALALVLFIEPMAFRSSSQFQPMAFGILYISLAYLSFEKWDKSQRERFLFICAVFFYLAYSSKVTYFYFLPGFLLFLYLHSGLKNTFKFLGVLLALLFVEYLFLNLISDQFLSLGKLSAIRKTHPPGSHPGAMGRSIVYSDYITMWLDVSKTNLLMLISSLGLLVVSTYHRSYRSLSTPFQAFSLMTASYIVLNMTLIVNFKTFQTPQGPFVKYLAVLMPFVGLTFCLALEYWSDREWFRLRQKKLEAAFAVIVLSIFIVQISKTKFTSVDHGQADRNGEVVYLDRNFYKINDQFAYLAEQLKTGEAIVVKSVFKRNAIEGLLTPLHFQAEEKLVSTPMEPKLDGWRYYHKQKFLIHSSEYEPKDIISKRNFNFRAGEQRRLYAAFSGSRK